jgi:hypothetical protein
MDGVGRLQDRLRPFSLSKPCGEDPPVLQGVSAAQPFEPVPSLHPDCFGHVTAKRMQAYEPDCYVRGGF